MTQALWDEHPAITRLCDGRGCESGYRRDFLHEDDVMSNPYDPNLLFLAGAFKAAIRSESQLTITVSATKVLVEARCRGKGVAAEASIDGERLVWSHVPPEADGKRAFGFGEFSERAISCAARSCLAVAERRNWDVSLDVPLYATAENGSIFQALAVTAKNGLTTMLSYMPSSQMGELEIFETWPGFPPLKVQAHIAVAEFIAGNAHAIAGWIEELSDFVLGKRQDRDEAQSRRKPGIA